MKVELLAITPNPEKLIEWAGRTCYQSHEHTKPGSEKNFIQKIIGNGHHSVLEHASATFRIKGGTRSFTHQLVRHRLCAFSQQPQRYVNEAKFDYMVPESIEDNPNASKLFAEFMLNSKNVYHKLQELGIKNEDARYVLPNAVQSEIVVSANFRELRHIFSIRCHKKAQLEIRQCALSMLRIMKQQAPAVFDDFVIDEENMTACTPFDK